MIELISDILSPEVITIIGIQVVSLLTIIIQNNYNMKNQREQSAAEIKRINKEFENNNEMQKIQNKSEIELKKLNVLYKYIMQEYFESEETKNIILSEFDSQGIVGDGPLSTDGKVKIVNLVEKNLELLSIEELEIYWNAKAEYEVYVLDYDMGNSNDHHLHATNSPSYYYFDKDKNFINHIKKEAKQIQERYYK